MAWKKLLKLGASHPSKKGLWKDPMRSCMYFKAFGISRHSMMFVFVVQLLSHIWLFATTWTATHQASLSFTISGSLLKLGSIVSMMPSNHWGWDPLLFLPSIFPSIRVFFNELQSNDPTNSWIQAVTWLLVIFLL